MHHRDGHLSNPGWTEEKRCEPAREPVVPRLVRRSAASAAQDEQLLFEQEVLPPSPSDTPAAEFRGRVGEVKQSEHDVPSDTTIAIVPTGRWDSGHRSPRL
jgi:hypothetical protein